MSDKTAPVDACWRCDGFGSYWRVPDGFNPFYAGGFQTARTMQRVSCYRCGGSGDEPAPAYGALGPAQEGEQT